MSEQLPVNTSPFQKDDPLFQDVQVLFTDPDNMMKWINSSDLLLSLLHAFQDKGFILKQDANGNGYNGLTKEINLNKSGADFVRVLSHELGHFYDHQLGDTDLVDFIKNDGVTNFDEIIKYEMNESQATAISFIIRQQIKLATNGTDIYISNRIDWFDPDGKELPDVDEDGYPDAYEAAIADLETRFGSRVTLEMNLSDCWTLAGEIANDIWGKNFLTMPSGETNRWQDRIEELNDAYTEKGKEIPEFLQDTQRTFKSADLSADGQYIFTFKEIKDGSDRTWVFNATLGSDGNDLLVGKETGGADHLSGGAGNDILYGDWNSTAFGADILEGGEGNDTLIGGKGQDTLDGGDGDDTFVITGTDTAYDIFIGGVGNDTIKGGDENDTIRVHYLSYENSIEVIDGGAGENVIAGTDGNDTINLSGIAVTNIARIEGGDGQDTIIGTGGQDHIDGGIGDDILIGGADADLMVGGDGIDIYFIDGNDTIQDSGRNYIYYQGEILAGGFVREEGTNTYRSLSDNNNFTLTFNSPGHLVLNGTDSVTFANQTSAADFENGDFGITLFDSISADRVLIGADGNDNSTVICVYVEDHWEGHYAFSGTVSGDLTNDYFLPSYDEFNLTGDTPPNLSIDGGAGNDLLHGLAGSDSITGGSGNDFIVGEIEWVSEYPEEYSLLNPWGKTGMADVLRGESGKDVILAWWGDDAVSGGDDDDFLEGGDGNDTVEGDGGNDVVVGSNGNDSIFGGDGNDLLYGDSELAFASWFNPEDIASFTFQMSFAAKGYVTSVLLENFDVFHDAPEPGDDMLYGGTGNDLLDGGAGNDTLLGEDDHDTLIGGSGDDLLDGGTGNDWLVGDNADLTGAGNDTLAGGDGDDLLQGLGGNDILNGDAGNDELYGFDGNDTLDGGADNDYLNGGTGDDTYLFGIGSGQDSIYETDGADTIRILEALPGAMTVTRDQYNIFLGVSNTTDRLKINGWFTGDAYRVEEVRFSDGTTWDGAALEARITAAPGTSGDDILYGGIGDDTYFFNPGGGADIIQPDPGGYDTVVMGMDYDPSSLSLYESGEDMIMRSSDGTQFTFIGWFTSSEHPIELFTFADGTQRSSTELLAEVPMWRLTIGSAANDRLYGDDGDDAINGGLGNDMLYGYGGDDQLDGGIGNDYLFGGAGDDILIGGLGRDYLFGGLGNDLYLFSPGFGSDVISDYYDEDIDPVNYQGEIDIIRFTDGILASDLHLTWDGSTWDGGSLTLRIGDLGDTLLLDISYAGGGWWYYGNFDGRNTAGIEQLEFSDGTVWTIPDLLTRLMDGTEGADELYGTSGDDTITGHGSNDWLEGFEGDDQMDGGDGNDVLFGGIGSDTIIGGAGDDVLYGNWQDTVGVDEENNILMGGDGNDELYGDYGNDVMSGGAGNDSLNGGEGNDLYLFNLGDGQDVIYNGNYDDEYKVDWLNPDIVRFGAGITAADIAISRDGDNLLLAIGGTGDSLTIGDWFENLYAAPGRGEQLEFADGTVWDVSDLAEMAADMGGPLFVGTQGDDILESTQSWSDDILLGKGGSDLLTGGDQCDWLDGGDGDDVLDGGSGEDFLYGGTGNDILAGGEGGDTYVFNTGDGRDIINDYQSYDYDHLAFGPGINPSALTDLTRTGSDLTIKVGTNGDQITFSNWFEDAYGQFDVSFADGTVWDTEYLTSHASEVTGGVVLVGTDGDDILTGTADNDTLQGGAGNDLLSGGDGDDTYLFNTGDGVDQIVDSSGMDTIQFGDGITSDSLSLDLGSLLVRVGDQGDAIHIEDFNPDDPLNSSVIETFRFYDGTVLDIADLLQRGFDIRGSAGDDWLAGTAIVDRITGEEGDDTLVGGQGDDILSGGSGNDTYVFNLGDGADIIADVSSATEGNIIAFGAGIAVKDLVFEHDGSDLLIHVGSQGDALRLKEFDRFGSNGSLVADTLQFADGSQADLFALTNTAPAVAVLPQNQTAVADMAYSFTIPADTFSDADAGDSLTYSATLGTGDDLPAWLIFDPATGTFSGTPANGDAGILDVAVTAIDTAGAAAVASFTLDIANHIVGTAWGDNLEGTVLRDVIEGLAGNDTLQGGDGDDIIIGGAGQDNLQGGAGDDLFLIEGNDPSYDTFNGGDGFDMVLGGDGDDVIRLGNFSGANTVELIDGGAGVNTIADTDYGNLIDLSNTTLINIARIESGLGGDTVIGSAGDDIIIGG
ncbi:MAG: putative Ig domain-containing protein, partial [Firmicutes bacterium]|nr:putative Ig domain-containing protein [Bacillota bacterium]